MILKNNNRKIEIKNIRKLSELGKIRGLMFRRRETCPALLFESKKPVQFSIHSWYVLFPFLAVWLDDKNKILDKKIVKPFQLFIPSKKKFYKLVEIPFNKKYSSELLLLGSFPVGERFKYTNGLYFL